MNDEYLYTYKAFPVPAFWSNVEVTDTCWRWTKTTKKRAYGSWTRNSKSINPGRFLKIMLDAPSDQSLFACHKCDNPPCVNPSHLFLGTYKDNAIDMVKKGGHVGLRKLTLEQVKEIRAKFQSGNFKRKELAALYKITLSGITQVIRKTRWINV